MYNSCAWPWCDVRSLIFLSFCFFLMRVLTSNFPCRHFDHNLAYLLWEQVNFLKNRTKFMKLNNKRIRFCRISLGTKILELKLVVSTLLWTGFRIYIEDKNCDLWPRGPNTYRITVLQLIHTLLLTGSSVEGSTISSLRWRILRCLVIRWD